MIRRPIKILSAVLAAALAVQDATWAAPDTFGGWAGWSARGGKTDMPQVAFTVPESAGFVDGGYRAPAPAFGERERLVILIQDAHVNPSSQLNAARILRVITDAEKIRTVHTEGAGGDVTLSRMLRAGSDPQAVRSAAESLVRKGRLAGFEFADLSAPGTLALRGVEDEALYDEALALYRSAAAERTAAMRFLDRASRAAETLAEELLGAELQALRRTRAAHQAGGLSTVDYFARLTAAGASHGVRARGYQHLGLFRRLVREERRLDFEAITVEQAEALAALTEEDRASLGELTADAGFLGRSAYWASARELGVEVRRGSQLARYLAYLNRARRMDAGAVGEELERFEEEIFVKLAPAGDARGLIEVIRGLETLRELITLQATPAAFRRYMAARPGHDPARLTAFLNSKIQALGRYYEQTVFLDEAYDAAERSAREFYELSVRRDAAMVRNLTARMDASGETRAVLVAGGYHAPGIERELRARGISYVSIVPAASHPTDQGSYEKILLAQPLTAGTAPAALSAPAASSKLIPRPLAAALRLNDPAAVRTARSLGLEFGGARMSASADRAERLKRSILSDGPILRDLKKMGADIDRLVSLPFYGPGQASFGFGRRTMGDGLKQRPSKSHITAQGDLLREDMARLIRQRDASGDRGMVLAQAGLGDVHNETSDLVGLLREAFEAAGVGSGGWNIDLILLDIDPEIVHRAREKFGPFAGPVRMHYHAADVVDSDAMEALSERLRIVVEPGVDYFLTRNVFYENTTADAMGDFALPTAGKFEERFRAWSASQHDPERYGFTQLISLTLALKNVMRHFGRTASDRSPGTRYLIDPVPAYPAKARPVFAPDGMTPVGDPLLGVLELTDGSRVESLGLYTAQAGFRVIKSSAARMASGADPDPVTKVRNHVKYPKGYWKIGQYDPETDIALSTPGILEHFVVSNKRAQRFLRRLPDAEKSGSDTVEVAGITFTRKMRRPKVIWTYPLKDIQALASASGFEIKTKESAAENRRASKETAEARKRMKEYAEMSPEQRAGMPVPAATLTADDQGIVFLFRSGAGKRVRFLVSAGVERVTVTWDAVGDDLHLMVYDGSNMRLIMRRKFGGDLIEPSSEWETSPDEDRSRVLWSRAMDALEAQNVSADGLAEMMRSARSGDALAREGLVLAYLPITSRALESIGVHQGFSDYMDLVAESNLRLMRQVDDWLAGGSDAPDPDDYHLDLARWLASKRREESRSRAVSLFMPVGSVGGAASGFSKTRLIDNVEDGDLDFLRERTPGARLAGWAARPVRVDWNEGLRQAIRENSAAVHAAAPELVRELGPLVIERNILDMDVDAYVKALERGFVPALRVPIADAADLERRIIGFYRFMASSDGNGYLNGYDWREADDFREILAEMLRHEWVSRPGGEAFEAEVVGYAADVFGRIISLQAFENGNHRIGDFVMNFILAKNGLPTFVLTTSNVIEYYRLFNTDALRRKGANGASERSAFIRREIRKDLSARISGSVGARMAVRTVELHGEEWERLTEGARRGILRAVDRNSIIKTPLKRRTFGKPSRSPKRSAKETRSLVLLDERNQWLGHAVFDEGLEGSAYLADLVIKKGQRGRDLGTRLMDDLFDRLRSEGRVDRVTWLAAGDSARFYQKYLTDRVPYWQGGDKFMALVSRSPRTPEDFGRLHPSIHARQRRTLEMLDERSARVGEILHGLKASDWVAGIDEAGKIRYPIKAGNRAVRESRADRSLLAAKVSRIPSWSLVRLTGPFDEAEEDGTGRIAETLLGPAEDGLNLSGENTGWSRTKDPLSLERHVPEIWRRSVRSSGIGARMAVSAVASRGKYSDERNQDSFLQMDLGGGWQVLAVFDGVGGAENGALASRAARDGVREYFDRPEVRELVHKTLPPTRHGSLAGRSDKEAAPRETLTPLLEDALNNAQERVRGVKFDEGNSGTTALIALTRSDWDADGRTAVWTVNYGDSQAALWDPSKPDRLRLIGVTNMTLGLSRSEKRRLKWNQAYLADLDDARVIEAIKSFESDALKGLDHDHADQDDRALLIKRYRELRRSGRDLPFGWREAEAWIYRRVTTAIENGYGSVVWPSGVNETRIPPGGALLLYTDGIGDVLTRREIARIVEREFGKDPTPPLRGDQRGPEMRVADDLIWAVHDPNYRIHPKPGTDGSRPEHYSTGPEPAVNPRHKRDDATVAVIRNQRPAGTVMPAAPKAEGSGARMADALRQRIFAREDRVLAAYGVEDPQSRMEVLRHLPIWNRIFWSRHGWQAALKKAESASSVTDRARAALEYLNELYHARPRMLADRVENVMSGAWQKYADGVMSSEVRIDKIGGPDGQARLILPFTPRPDSGYPSVVLLHGFGADRWEPCLDPIAKYFLRAGYAVVRPDLPGHGSNLLVRIDRSTASGWVKELMYQARERSEGRLDPAQIHALGFSVGGDILMRYAAEPGDFVPSDRLARVYAMHPAGSATWGVWRDGGWLAMLNGIAHSRHIAESLKHFFGAWSFWVDLSYRVGRHWAVRWHKGEVRDRLLKAAKEGRFLLRTPGSEDHILVANDRKRFKDLLSPVGGWSEGAGAHHPTEAEAVKAAEDALRLFRSPGARMADAEDRALAHAELKPRLSELAQAAFADTPIPPFVPEPEADLHKLLTHEYAGTAEFERWVDLGRGPLGDEERDFLVRFAARVHRETSLRARLAAAEGALRLPVGIASQYGFAVIGVRERKGEVELFVGRNVIYRGATVELDAIADREARNAAESSADLAARAAGEFERELIDGVARLEGSPDFNRFIQVEVSQLISNDPRTRAAELRLLVSALKWVHEQKTHAFTQFYLNLTGLEEREAELVRTFAEAYRMRIGAPTPNEIRHHNAVPVVWRSARKGSDGEAGQNTWDGWVNVLFPEPGEGLQPYGRAAYLSKAAVLGAVPDAGSSKDLWGDFKRARPEAFDPKIFDQARVLYPENTFESPADFLPAIREPGPTRRPALLSHLIRVGARLAELQRAIQQTEIMA